MNTTPLAAIEVNCLSYRPALRKEPVLKDVSFTVRPGEHILILGASGSGKSTLMLALAGLLGSDDEGDLSGVVQIHGHDPRSHKGHAGLVMQDPETQVVMHRIFDDIAFGPENLNVAPDEISRRVQRSQELVGLNLEPNHSTSALSGGQKQRLALASILAMQPRVLLLDEPTANLDPDGVDEVVQATRNVLEQTGSTLVVVEHRVDPWLDLIDRVLVVDEGTIIADGSPQDIFNPEHPQFNRLIKAGVWLATSLNSHPSSHCSKHLTTQALSPDQTAFYNVKDPVCITAHSQEQAPIESGFQDLLSPSSDGNGCVTFNDGFQEDMHVDSGCKKMEPLKPTKSKGGQGREAALNHIKQAILTALNLDIGYAADAPIQTQVNLEIFEGESVCITGKNGSGKTTLALTLAGLLDQLDGQVIYAHTGSDPHAWRSAEYLGRLAFVFQEPEAQFVAQTVEDELMVALKVMGMKDAQAKHRILKTLKRLHLLHLAKAHPMTLSGGEKRRLSVATALVCAPRIIILDEPTFGQDAKTWAELVALLREAQNQGTTIISVTHDQAFIDAFADRVIHLQPRSSHGQSLNHDQQGTCSVETLRSPKVGKPKEHQLPANLMSGNLTPIEEPNAHQVHKEQSRVIQLHKRQAHNEQRLSEQRLSEQLCTKQSDNERLSAQQSQIKQQHTEEPVIEDLHASQASELMIEKLHTSQTSDALDNTVPSWAQRCSARPARVTRYNPVAQLLGLIFLTTPLLISIDLVSAGIALLLEAALFWYLQIPLWQLGKRAMPLLFAAPLVGLSMLLYAEPSGVIYATYGPAVISSHSCMVAASITLRVFALALPAIALLGHIDPSDMAAGLSQILKLPARPVLASLAGVRLMGLFAENYRTVQMAHRVRGVLSKMAFRARLSLIFALLVFALRRSASLSLTMEARGFGYAQNRTWVRRSVLTRADLMFIGVSLTIPLISLALAMLSGQFTPFGYR